MAASVVPKDKQASAVAMMFMGLTIANIGGVPLATWLSQNTSWRMAFAAISILRHYDHVGTMESTPARSRCR